MWSAGTKVDVYLGSAEGALALGGERPAWAPHSDVGAAAAHWFAEARERIGTRLRRPRVRVWLSGVLARPFVWGPVEGLARWREVELAARAAAPEATGLRAPCAVELDEWPGHAPVLVVAMEERTVAAIVEAAEAARVRLASMRPWWAGVLERQADTTTAAFSICDTDAMTVLAASSGWTLAHAYWPLPNAHERHSLLDRLMLSAGVEPGAARHADLTRDSIWPASPEAAA